MGHVFFEASHCTTHSAARQSLEDIATDTAMEGMLAWQASELIAGLKRSQTDGTARVGIVHEECKATMLTRFLNR
jgi:hypothetical protein